MESEVRTFYSGWNKPSEAPGSHCLCRPQTCLVRPAGWSIGPSEPHLLHPQRPECDGGLHHCNQAPNAGYEPDHYLKREDWRYWSSSLYLRLLIFSPKSVSSAGNSLEADLTVWNRFYVIWLEGTNNAFVWTVIITGILRKTSHTWRRS